MANKMYLESLSLPQDLKRLTPAQQELICCEIRQKMLETVSENGGHLASNLGVVELTVALHTVFESPDDAIVWDVGHQCYVHKMLTGRLAQMDTLRTKDGVSGFPRPKESEHDTFIAGHASTSLSVASGIARAKTLSGDPHHTIAIIGDGAFTGGMVYEGLNNAGRGNDNLIVILNDNDMSISKSVGSVAKYLTQIRNSSGYIELKDMVEDTVRKIPVIGEDMRDMIAKSKSTVRQTLYHTNLFEYFGFDYIGPVDGHDLPMLIRMLNRAKQYGKPVLVHVNTVKGKGYTFAESNPARFHGVGKFDCDSGRMPKSSENFSKVFGKTLHSLALRDDKVCAITAAMQDSTGLDLFAQDFPERFFDVGIAEAHAVTFASGLAAGGMKPVFAVYSTFLQRAYDQLIHDASIQPQHVVLGIDRAGLVGGDGETHQGLFDVAMLSGIPGSTIYSPATFELLEWSLSQAVLQHDGVVAVRYPRGGETLPPASQHPTQGDFCHISRGGDILLVTYGREYGEVYAAADKLAQQGCYSDILLLNKIMPISKECISIAQRYKAVCFIEEGILHGGIGEHFAVQLIDAGYPGAVRVRAIEQPFVPAMDYKEALAFTKLDADSIADDIKTIFQTNTQIGDALEKTT